MVRVLGKFREGVERVRWVVGGVFFWVEVISFFFVFIRYKVLVSVWRMVRYFF